MQEILIRNGEMTFYLVDPRFLGPFPYHWPREDWPLVKEIARRRNQITDAGRLKSYMDGLNFNYVAGGIGTLPPGPLDVALDNEAQRFAVEEKITQVGQVDIYTTIPSGTGNITWQEWGLFMNDASITQDSGTLYSRLLEEVTKSLGDQLLIKYTILETLA